MAAAYRRIVPTAFAGTVAWGSPVRSLRFIGPAMAASLAAPPFNCHTLLDVVVHFSGLLGPGQSIAARTQTIHQQLTLATRNPRGLTCTDSPYLIRPFNRMAYNVLADLLSSTTQLQDTRLSRVSAFFVLSRFLTFARIAETAFADL